MTNNVFGGTLDLTQSTLREHMSLAAFKSKLKKYLFRRSHTHDGRIAMKFVDDDDDDDLTTLIEQHSFCTHFYADDTQVYGSSRPSATYDVWQRQSACTDNVHNWMQSNRL